MDSRYQFPLTKTLPLTPEQIEKELSALSILERFPGDEEFLMTIYDEQATFEDLERARAMYDQAFSSTGQRRA